MQTGQLGDGPEVRAGEDVSDLLQSAELHLAETGDDRLLLEDSAHHRLDDLVGGVLRHEEQHVAWGVALDDIAAGVYANAILQIIWWLDLLG